MDSYSLRLEYLFPDATKNKFRSLDLTQFVIAGNAIIIDYVDNLGTVAMVVILTPHAFSTWNLE